MTRLPDAVLEAAQKVHGCDVHYGAPAMTVYGCPDCLDRLLTCPAVVEYLTVEARRKALEEAAQLMETNAIIGPTIGPLFNAGWAASLECNAKAIRALLTSDPRSPDDA